MGFVEKLVQILLVCIIINQLIEGYAWRTNVSVIHISGHSVHDIVWIEYRDQFCIGPYLNNTVCHQVMHVYAGMVARNALVFASIFGG